MDYSEHEILDFKEISNILEGKLLFEIKNPTTESINIYLSASEYLKSTSYLHYTKLYKDVKDSRYIAYSDRRRKRSCEFPCKRCNENKNSIEPRGKDPFSVREFKESTSKKLRDKVLCGASNIPVLFTILKGRLKKRNINVIDVDYELI